MRMTLSSLQDAVFDVAVIGGGINGASAAQQLAAAGYRTLIVEKGDFGSGSTARSSRLLHCGLRYLAPGRSLFEFVRHPGRFVEALRMARQAMHARHDIVRTSPSSVNRMQFCFPIYRGDRYRGWQLDAAFKLLSTLGPADLPLDYVRLAPEAAARRPLLGWLRDFEALDSVAVFREYQLDWPERICMDAVLEAERLGTVARNYTLARLISRDRSDGWSIGLRDVLTVEPEIRVRAKLVLNMAGIWIDDVSRTANPCARRKVLKTKGCHIVVRLPDECRGYGIATLNSKQEPFYCIPWHDLHYFGPTETVYNGDCDRILVTEDEIAWIIGEANHLLPPLKLTRADVISTWAGVRPLTYDMTLPAGRRSREIHDLGSDGLPDVFAMTAGPVMTHRSAGQELVGVIRERLAPSGCERERSYTPSPLRFARDRLVGADRLGPREWAALAGHVEGEHAVSLTDVLFRRTGVAWRRQLGSDEVREAASVIGARLGWAPHQIEAEIEKYHAEVCALHGPSYLVSEAAE
jgi:glycerol-3-phosphate dehydrogenase